MSTKAKLTKGDIDLERARIEGNWTKAEGLAKTIITKTSQSPALFDLISCEKVIEEAYARNPLIDQKTTLRDAINIDDKAYSEATLKLQDVILLNHSLKVEAQLLLLKLQFFLADFVKIKETLAILKLDDLSLSSPRSVQLQAEAYTLKGLCLENKKLEPNEGETALSVYEKGNSLAVTFLNLVENYITKSGFGNNVPLKIRFSEILELCVQKVPLVHLQQGEIWTAIERLRQLLIRKDLMIIPRLRQCLARQLAEILVRTQCECSYKPLDNTNEKRSTLASDVTTLTVGSSQPKSKRGTRQSPGVNLKYLKLGGAVKPFIPNNLTEEAVLLLMVADLLASQEAVLSRSEEHSHARKLTYIAATAVHDILTQCLSRLAYFDLLCESLERALKFSFKEQHVWRQFAMSLLSAGRFERALLALEECVRIHPKDNLTRFLIAKICFTAQLKYSKGLRYLKDADEDRHVHPLLAARKYLLLGVGTGLEAFETSTGEKEELLGKCEKHLEEARSLDVNDHLAPFYLALLSARKLDIEKAIQRVKSSIHYRPDFIPSQHLLCLLVSATGRLNDALSIIQDLSESLPDDIGLLHTLARLQMATNHFDLAIETGKRMLFVWAASYNLADSGIEDTESVVSVPPERRTTMMDRMATSPSPLSDFPTDSLEARSTRGSLAASKVEQALTEIASSVMTASGMAESLTGQPWQTLMKIWLLLAELYLEAGVFEDCQACLMEAAAIQRHSNQVFYFKGRLWEARGDFHEARFCYQAALSANLEHVQASIHLGLIEFKEGNLRLAEKLLRSAIKSDPNSNAAWCYLGEVLRQLGEVDSAKQCLLKASKLQMSEPVVPFFTLFKCYV